MTAHRDLTGDDLHEPKGVESASLGQVYVANGEASGEWKQIGVSEINPDEIKNTNKYKLHYELKDISTASNIYIPISVDSRLTGVLGVMSGVITGADTKIEFKNGGLTSMGILEVPYTTSGAGVLVEHIPASNFDIVAPSYIVMVCDGASTGVVDLNLVLDFEYI